MCEFALINFFYKRFVSLSVRRRKFVSIKSFIIKNEVENRLTVILWDFFLE
jgi:hypothetical protein